MRGMGLLRESSRGKPLVTDCCWKIEANPLDSEKTSVFRASRCMKGSELCCARVRVRPRRNTPASRVEAKSLADLVDYLALM
jgi:hypothetical protein